MSIRRILRDPIWQFLGTIAGLLAILATYNIFFLEREVKALHIVTLASTSMVKVEQSITEDINVLYRDQPIANLSLFQIKIENAGNQAIREEDYVRPIKFTFPPQAEIVEADIVESRPPNIGMTVQWDQNHATLSPVLLNAQDRAIVRLLVTNMPFNSDAQPFDVDARIAEVKEVHLVEAIEETILDRLAHDRSFRSGFFGGLFMALVVGWASRQILYYWNRVLQFYISISEPTVARPGPSSLRGWTGALLAFLILATIVIFTLFLMNRFLGLI